MDHIERSFRRYEKKFLLTPRQYEAITPILRERMTEDTYGTYTICNIYYDTDSYDLIRVSLDKPSYKEKFRLRSYGVPARDDNVFAEIKKKYDGVVYKRRVEAVPSAIRAFVSDGRPLHRDAQIQREIQWLLRMYRPTPKVFIGYDRVALTGLAESGLRITFDRNIRFRTAHLDLCDGDFGAPLLSDDRIVMEVKTPSAVPLWLASLLSANEAYPTSFSKYGACYQQHIAPKVFQKGSFSYA